MFVFQDGFTVLDVAQSLEMSNALKSKIEHQLVSFQENYNQILCNMYLIIDKVCKGGGIGNS